MSERNFGYAIDQENKDSLLLNAQAKPGELVALMETEYLPLDAIQRPEAIVNVVDQGSVGSCQGQSLAKCFQICYFLATGRALNFSAMCGYIIAQQFDGIRGDRGSTLSGGQLVATRHGMCLERYWPDTKTYDTRPKTNEFPFKLVAATPTNNPDEVRKALGAGLPVQTGVAWKESLDEERPHEYRGRSLGGHSTVLWGDYHINSWGKGWNGDGMSNWMDCLDEIITFPGNTFVIYAPDSMSMPFLDPVKTYG